MVALDGAVMGLPAGHGQLIAEVARIAVMPGGSVERAHALLEPLHRLLHFDAAAITLLDPARRRQPPLAHRGYPERVRRYLDSPAFVDHLELIGMQRHRRPMRLKDLPMAPEEYPLWAEHLRPAGFGEGLGVAVTTADGRYLGVIAASTETSTPASDGTVSLLHCLTPLIAHMVDPLRDPIALAGLVADAFAGTVLTRAGAAVALPGLPGHRLLADGSAVLTAARAGLDRGPARAMFLAPRTGATASDLVKVTALAVQARAPGELRAVVLLSPPPHGHGLTLRELEVLGLLVEGCSNAAIGAALNVAVRTAISHVEHIMVKLDAGSRMAAAVRAERLGLYLPAELRLARAGGAR
jgi:DNA-binding CsgD family transcriptional regulator